MNAHDDSQRSERPRWRWRLTRVAAAGAVIVAVSASIPVIVLGAGRHHASLVGSSCPLRAERLPADALAGATDAALRHAAASDGNSFTKGEQAVQADRAAFDHTRGAQVRHECGFSAEQRTVIVYLDYAAEHPSASLSEGVLFVSKFRDGYRTWQIAH